MITISEVACFSFSGPGKASNEDCIFAPVQVRDDSIFLAIADGVGSLDGSAIASKSVILSITDSINNKVQDIKGIFNNAYEAVSESDAKIATTLTVARLDNSKISIGHIGDCRAYVLIDGKLKQLTKDHTKYQSLISSGEYNSYQLRKHKDRLSSVLTSAIAKEFPLDYDEFNFDIMDYVDNEEIVIYLMSDGAYHHWDKRKRFSNKTMLSPLSFSSSLRKRIEKDMIDDYSLVGVKIKVSKDKL